MTFFWHDEAKRSSGPVQSLDYERAEALNTAVRNKAKVHRGFSLRSWADEFRRIREVDGIDNPRIQRVLEWYIQNIRGKFVPLAFSAASFRQKFLNIEACYERQEGPAVLVSLEAKQITNKILRLRWPSTTKDQLEKSVQVCLDAYKEFLAALNIMYDTESLVKGQRAVRISTKTSADDYGKLKNFVLHLKQKLPSPARFVEQWFNETNKRIINWDGYDGDLRRFEIVVTDKRFLKYGRDIASSYCGDAKRFDTLLKAIS